MVVVTGTGLTSRSTTARTASANRLTDGLIQNAQRQLAEYR
jgi:hypothetical protein